MKLDFYVNTRDSVMQAQTEKTVGELLDAFPNFSIGVSGLSGEKAGAIAMTYHRLQGYDERASVQLIPFTDPSGNWLRVVVTMDGGASQELPDMLPNIAEFAYL